MKVILILVALLCVSVVSAQVQITKVYYNPVDESGSEAVEIQNIGNDTVDISGWLLSTETTIADATLSAVLQPQQKFLIADVGWSEQRDDSGWQLADHEEAITLTNTNAGVALRNSTHIVDAVGWGIPTEINAGLYLGTPTEVAEQGQMLMRSQFTGNNINDYVVVPADFFSSQYSIPIIAVILEPETEITSVVIADADESTEGIQIVLTPNATTEVSITVESNSDNVTVSAFDTSFALEQNGTTFSGTLEILHTQAPGTYDVIVQAGTAQQTISVEVLSLLSFAVQQNALYFEGFPNDTPQSSFSVSNSGNVPLTLSLAASPLQGIDVIDATFTFFVDNAEVQQVSLAVEESRVVDISWLVPDAAPGEYTGSVTIAAGES